jgi:hypothetical protein
MFPKLLAVVLAAALTAAALLVARHQRIETAHRMAAVRQRMIERRAALWALERAIAERCDPAVIRDLVEGDPAWSTIARPPAGGTKSAPTGSVARGPARREAAGDG